MCGIAGILAIDNSGSGEELAELARAMAGRMTHRGPDGAGLWTDTSAGLALAHRRLAVIDLTEAGHQPMTSACGRWTITYNGEVYNAREIGDELARDGARFRGHSDTEVIVEACSRWGLAATLERLIGMFAFALWDGEQRRLFLVRDRLGIKPLYWGRIGRRIVFASELKAFRALPDFAPMIDRSALAAFLRHNCVPGPHSIFQGIEKLQPGAIVEIDTRGEAKRSRYWSLEDVARAGLDAPLDAGDGEAVDVLDALLKDAVGRRMIADVPLGALLSGGVDSSTVAALMQAQSDRPVRTFSIGFDDADFDEASHAKAVATHLGTDHTELYVTAQAARDVIPKLPEIYDEPFADSSQIPTFLVCEMTRQHVTVALSGDGGDELFAGYNRYAQAARFAKLARRAPGGLRRLGGRAMEAVPTALWDRVFQAVPESRRPRQAGDKMHKLARVLGEDEDGFYRRLISHWDAPDEIVPEAREAKGLAWDDGVREVVPGFVERMQYLDTLTYLPDDILTKVDRASMAVSLEARVPILDHRVVALAWRLPPRFKLRDGQSKWALRQVLYRYVPRALIDRPKSGFAVPIEAWLRGPLRAWCEELLEPAALAEGGLLAPEPIRARWHEHLSGRRNWAHHIWDILMLQAWRKNWGI